MIDSNLVYYWLNIKRCYNYKYLQHFCEILNCLKSKGITGRFCETEHNFAGFGIIRYSVL